MSVENGEWILRGLNEDDPRCLLTPEALTAYIEEVGFLPLFATAGIPDFSVEERTAVGGWWTDDPTRDPWLWRQVIAAEGRVAYGKFFAGKAGFISRAWFPYFVNARRDGYDFDARWEDGKASFREKKIMDLFAAGEERFSTDTRLLAGFGKGGEKNFEGTVTSLQRQTYLVIRDFRCRLNRQGAPYGWPIAVYTAPESLWGYEDVTSAYVESPAVSRDRILRRAATLRSDAEPEKLRRLLG